MAKSLRWRIQFWYGVLLLAVLLGFSGFVYGRMRAERFRQIDTELEGAGQALIAVLRSVPPGDLNRDRPAPVEDDPGRRRPPRGWRDRLELPAGFLDRNPRTRPYFICWQGNETLARSPEAPERHALPMPVSLVEERPYFHSQREMRNVVIGGPAGTIVAVGRSIEPEIGELNRWLVMLLSASAIIFVFGTMGGTWLSSRALAPLAAMSDTAAAMSAENLSQRIDTTSVDDELAELAETLNKTFARLEQAFQRQATFTADASHELRTPLTIILGHLERILAREKLTPDTTEALQACSRAAKRMKSLSEELLMLARADAGKISADKEQFDLRAVVEEVVELLIPLGQKKNIVLKPELEAVEVPGDAKLLSRVVLNLITNAIQHHGGNGQVVVRLKSDSGFALLQVIDDGPGISEAGREQLFQRFYRADAARSRSSGGSGLGLAISQAIVQAHRGEITCESTVGKGTCFTVRLPAA